MDWLRTLYVQTDSQTNPDITETEESFEITISTQEVPTKVSTPSEKEENDESTSGIEVLFKESSAAGSSKTN